ncbi:MAG: immunoglobulin domain-containing protein [Oscillospiraceae bacterium]|nr:immunoglobulin domain-containing protein [Oscillospiraceae bacterium]
MKSLRFLLALLLCLALCLSLNPAAWAADAAVKPPVITGQPKALIVGENGSAKLNVQASGSALQYQWQFAEGDAWKDCDESGSNSAFLTVRGDVDADGREYRCIVSNEGGSVTSASALLTVKLKSPVILKQPQNQTVREDETASFAVTASGSKLSYQWQTLVNGLWKDCDDVTGDTYAPVGSAATKGSKYRCVVSNSGGAVNSSAVTLTVKLRDDEKLEEVQALTKAKSYDEAIECAESYFSGTPMEERSDALLKACVHAYVLKSDALQRSSKCEEAEQLLRDCAETYAGTAAVKEAETAAAKLDATIKRGEPQNATYFQSSAKGGSCEVTIKNGDSPVVVKIEDKDNPNKCVTIFLRKGQNAKFNIKDGDYIVKFAKGSRWYSKDELFGSETEYSKWSHTIEAVTIKSGGYLTRWLFTITINDNMNATPIDAEDF